MHVKNTSANDGATKTGQKIIYFTLNGLDLILSRLVGFSFFSSFPFIFNTGPEMTKVMGES